MNLEESIKAMLGAQDDLRTKRGVLDPDYISLQMQILAQATASVENYLASFEKDYEINYAKLLGEYLTSGASATATEQRVRIELAQEKGEIKYLTRIVSSAWRLVSTAQSRHNHLTTEQKMGRVIT